MPAATKPSCARVRVASSAASAVSIPSRRRAAGPARPAAPSTLGAAVRSYLPLRRRGPIQAAALSSGGDASSTAAPSIGSTSRAQRTNDDASALFLPDAFALLGLNRAAARASVIQAYEEAAGNEIEEGFSKAAIAARAVVLKAAADVLLEPQDRLAHERGLLPLSEAIGGGAEGNGNGNGSASLAVGALMLSREAASRAPSAATGARASADVAARGEALLSAVGSGGLSRGGGGGGGLLGGLRSSSGAAATARDAALATALAHCDAAAAALAADAGRRSGAAAAARLARAVELLDEHHTGSRETASLREEAARALEEMTAATAGGNATLPAAAAATRASSAAAASNAAAATDLDAPPSPAPLLSSAAEVLASSFSASDRRVALDTLCRAVAPSSLSGSEESEEETRPALAAAWPHLTAEEQVELLDAAEAGTKKRRGNKNAAAAATSPVPAAAAAAALISAAVSRGSPSLVARAERLLDAEVSSAAAAATSAAPPPPSSAARAARVAAALMLGDVAAAEAAVGVSAARQLLQLRNAASPSPSSSPYSSVPPDPRLVAYVSSFDPQDPLPGLCALAEAWVREAALGGCRPPSSPSSSAAFSSSPSDFSLAAWASSPAVALRLAAGEHASAARAAAGAARRAAAGVGGACRAAAVGVRSFAGGLASSLKGIAAAGGSKGGSSFEVEGEREEPRDDEIDAAYRARFYGDEEEEAEQEEEAGREVAEAEEEAAPPRRRASSRPPSSSRPLSSSLQQQQQHPPPLPIEAAKAKTVGELAAAYARATDAAAWRSSPLPPDAVRPLEGEDDLWLGTTAARGGKSFSLPSPLLSSSSLARTVAGGVVLLGAALAVSRAAAGPALSGRINGAATAAAAAPAAAASSPLSAKEAKALLSQFQSAKAQACGPSSSPDASAASSLEKVLCGKLLAEWRGRQRELDGWTLSYKTKTLRVVEVVAPSSGLLSRLSSSGDNRAVFLARVEEKVTLRDEEGAVVDESDAGYDARFVAERKGRDGAWKLSECFLN